MEGVDAHAQCCGFKELVKVYQGGGSKREESAMGVIQVIPILVTCNLQHFRGLSGKSHQEKAG